MTNNYFKIHVRTTAVKAAWIHLRPFATASTSAGSSQADKVLATVLTWVFPFDDHSPNGIEMARAAVEALSLRVTTALPKAQFHECKLSVFRAFYGNKLPTVRL